jgi:hypothetical protein
MKLTIGQAVNWRRIQKGSNAIRRFPAKIVALTPENAQILLDTPIEGIRDIDPWVRRSSLERRSATSITPDQS